MVASHSFLEYEFGQDSKPNNAILTHYSSSWIKIKKFSLLSIVFPKTKRSQEYTGKNGPHLLYHPNDNPSSLTYLLLAYLSLYSHASRWQLYTPKWQIMCHSAARLQVNPSNWPTNQTIHLGQWIGWTRRSDAGRCKCIDGFQMDSNQ